MNSASVSAITTTGGPTPTHSASASISVGPTVGPAGAPAAKINNGTIVGVYNSQYDQDFFLGVPYAQRKYC